MNLPVNQVVVGDCTEIMQTWPADSIDLVVTSPPYWGLRDYGSETVRVWGGRPECEHTWDENTHYGGGGQPGEKVRWQHTGQGPSGHPKIRTNFCINCGAWRGSLGLEPHPQMFIDHLVEVCREIKRVLKPLGTFWLNLGDTYYASGGAGGDYNPGGLREGQPRYKQLSKTRSGWLQPKQKLMIPSRVAIELQHDGWILRNDLIWFKPNHMPSSVKDRLTNAYEHVFLFAKARRYYFDLDAIRKPHAASTIQRITQPNVMNQPGGDKQRELRGEGGGNASRSADMVKSLARNYEEWYFKERKKKSWHDHEHDEIMGFGQQKRGFKVENLPHPRGKNPADVWRIPTMPFKGAHFSVFPPKLIEPIIKAGSPRWICNKCGKPRERISETEYVKSPVHGDGSIMGRRDGGDKLTHYNGLPRVNAIHHTVGWSDCGCGEGWEPGVVLDPFGGSGTVGQVARRLGRRFILIEIIPEYCKMAEQRVRGRYKPIPEGLVQLTLFMETEK